MDFSILKRIEALIALAAVAAVSSAGTVLVVQPAADAGGCEQCLETVAVLRARLAEQEDAGSELERWKRRTRPELADTPIDKESARRR